MSPPRSGPCFCAPLAGLLPENWALYVLRQVGGLGIKPGRRGEKPLIMLPYRQDSSVLHPENTQCVPMGTNREEELEKQSPTMYCHK